MAWLRERSGSISTHESCRREKNNWEVYARERFNEEILHPRGEEHFTVNLAYTGKAARELSLATGRPAFTIDSFLSTGAASKFALQKANGEPPMLEVAGENILIPKGQGAQLVIRVDEASGRRGCR